MSTGTINVPIELLEKVAYAPSGELILSVCLDMAGFLCEKNSAYGNAAFEPINIYSKVDAEGQAYMSIDNKLNRLFKGKEYAGDDTLLDLAGYIIILYAIKARNRAVQVPREPEPTYTTTPSVEHFTEPMPADAVLEEN